MDSDQTEIDLQKLLRQQLHSLAQFGVREIGAGKGDFAVEFETADPVPAAETTGTQVVKESQLSTFGAKKAAGSATSNSLKASPTPVNSAATKSWGAPTAKDQRPAGLEVIHAEVRDCVKCEELCTKRTQTVFGVGDPSARLVFVGEGPGADEDRLGEPFVGAAGKLLNKILAASNLKREEVYILNTVKCRPPRNRNPTEIELENCWEFAQRQLEVIQPEFICCLGSVAAKTMLQTTQSLGRLRGRFHAWRGARLVVTYHPAYCLLYTSPSPRDRQKSRMPSSA